MEIDTCLSSIHALREQRQVCFALNSLGQIGTADAEFRDPLAFSVDPTGDDGDLPIAELAQRLRFSEKLVAEIILVSDCPCHCALRSMLLDACGLAQVKKPTATGIPVLKVAGLEVDAQQIG